MLIVQVHVHVKDDCIGAFRAESAKNAAASLKEPGIARFDVLQSEEDPARFVLVEAYRDDAAPAAHKATAHYAAWRDAVEGMMSEPRRSVKYRAAFPGPEGWGMP